MLALVILSVTGSAPAGTAGVSERALGHERAVRQDGRGLLAVPTYPTASTASMAAPRSETRRCPDHRAGVRWYRAKHRHWNRLRHAPAPRQGRKPRSCPDARFLAVRARERSRNARTVTERWVARHVLEDFRVRPGANAWLRAVDEVQRVFPGTSGWLLSCSASEGGHGRRVMNSQGSGATDWLQFMPETYARMSWAARVYAASRGFIVPYTASQIHSPLGQALAGAWGVTNGRRHEWAGHGC